MHILVCILLVLKVAKYQPAGSLLSFKTVLYMRKGEVTLSQIGRDVTHVRHTTIFTLSAIQIPGNRLPHKFSLETASTGQGRQENLYFAGGYTLLLWKLLQGRMYQRPASLLKQARSLCQKRMQSPLRMESSVPYKLVCPPLLPPGLCRSFALRSRNFSSETAGVQTRSYLCTAGNLRFIAVGVSQTALHGHARPLFGILMHAYE